jgi:hypothetical protein
MLVLKPSKIKGAGVGVFTIQPIKKGERVDLFSQGEKILLIKTNKPNFLQKRFCPYDKEEGGYWCPTAFNRMSIGWYINHSKKWNIEARTWVATKHIKKGEELTTNYKVL